MRDFSQDTNALSLNTATLGHNVDGHGAGWTCEQVIDACAERGYGGIVFWQREVTDPVALGLRTRAAGLRVDGLCRTPYLTGRDAGSDDAIKHAIDTAAGLGAPVVTIVTGGTDPGHKGVMESQKRLCDRLAWAVDYAAKHDINLALEPLNPMFGGNRTCLFTAADALAICDAINHHRLGVAIDVYHVWWDTALAASLASAKGRIFGFHLCDWLENTTDMLLDRGMMGDGVADLKGIRRIVENMGYSGPCEVEVFSSRHWWTRPPNEVLDIVKTRFCQVC